MSNPNKRIKLVDVLKHPWLMKANKIELEESEHNQPIDPKSDSEQITSSLEVHDSYIPLGLTFKLKKPFPIKKGTLSPKAK